MDAQQMHIEFETAYQNMASNVHRGFEADEIDWLLNSAVETFINERTKPHKREGNPTFQMDSKSSSDLHTLVDDDNLLPVDKYNATTYRALLPGDYRLLISARPYTLRTCDKGFDAAVVRTPFYFGKLSIPKTTSQTTPYKEFVVKLNGETIFDITNYHFEIPLVDKAQRFVVIGLLLDVLSENGVSFYWEKYISYTTPLTLFIEQTTVVNSITVTIDGVTTAGTAGTTIRNVPAPSLLNPPVLGTMSSSRWTKSEQAYDLSVTPFFQSMYDSPLTSLAKGHVKIFGRDQSFIVTQCMVDYIRNPRVISLSLDRSCDLPAHTHPEICGIAAEKAFLYTQRPDWEKKVQDNTLRL